MIMQISVDWVEIWSELWLELDYAAGLIVSSSMQSWI